MAFQEFKAFVENQARKINVLRSNNGGEYTSTEIEEFCRGAGINRGYIVLYKPQKKGVAKRKNKAIEGAARAMLHDHRIPFFLLGKACNTAMYLQNKNPHRVLGSKTPEEAFTDKKPKVGHIKIFGCLTYSHIPFRITFQTTISTLPLREKGVLHNTQLIPEEYNFSLHQGFHQDDCYLLLSGNTLQLHCPLLHNF